MRNLTSPAWIKVKGGLLLLLGLLATVLILLQRPTLQICILLAIWAFCRFYYFAFYVFEHYVDPTYHFTGLLSFARYLIRKAGD